MQQIKWKAPFIWTSPNQSEQDFAIFIRDFELGEAPQSALAYLTCDTKYWLYINGRQVVFEGGLFRESVPGGGWADQVDVAPYLQGGKNRIAVLCWYYGNEGRNNKDSGRAGFSFDCPDLGIKSDKSFLCMRHPAYFKTGQPLPAYLYGGDNIGFDARRDIDWTNPDFADDRLQPACEMDACYWGPIELRPIPQLKISQPMDFAFTKTDYGYCIRLPHAMQFTPYFTVQASGGEVIDIRSDRYQINGGPGDETHCYNAHRIEYICTPGQNLWDCPHYLYGEQIELRCPDSVRLITAGCRESGYDTNIVGSFHCGCAVTDKLVEKAARTLYVCMRDNFMDCPDRERGQWIGDVSVQVPQTFFLLDQKATPLVKKAIYDFVRLRNGDVLWGNVPGVCSQELPSQSLNAISMWGMAAQYYHYTGDVQTLAVIFEPAVRYLALWQMGDDGLMRTREGNWNWYDHLQNADGKVLENCWYYSALQFALKMADVLGDHRFDDMLEQRSQSIAGAFEQFWNGSCYTSGSVVDDRANAMAVLAGLCPAERYSDVMKILLSVFNCTVYMENYVLTALCEMGYIHEAYRRMVSRYYNLAVNQNSTLWEDFFILGTKNHAWSGAPATIAFCYFMGVQTNDGFSTFRVNPVQNLFQEMHCRFEIRGKQVSIRVSEWGKKVEVENQSDARYVEAQ